MRRIQLSARTVLMLASGGNEENQLKDGILGGKSVVRSNAAK